MKKVVLFLLLSFSHAVKVIVKDPSISEKAAATTGEDVQDTLINNNVGDVSFSDFVEEMQEGSTDDDTFLAMYNHKSTPDDDERYVKIKFNKYSEQAWDDKGK